MHPEALAGSIEESCALFARFLKGFDGTNATKQAPGVPNHAAWTLGHCALYAFRSEEKLRGVEPAVPPGGGWTEGDGTAGGPERFDTESVCYGSVPVDNPALYPSFARCVEIFERAHAGYAAYVRTMSKTDLAREISWGSTRVTGDRMVIRMNFHLGTHAGQLVDLRRGLGMGSVLG